MNGLSGRLGRSSRVRAASSRARTVADRRSAAESPPETQAVVRALRAATGSVSARRRASASDPEAVFEDAGSGRVAGGAGVGRDVVGRDVAGRVGAGVGDVEALPLGTFVSVARADRVTSSGRRVSGRTAARPGPGSRVISLGTGARESDESTSPSTTSLVVPATWSPPSAASSSRSHHHPAATTHATRNNRSRSRRRCGLRRLLM